MFVCCEFFTSFICQTDLKMKNNSEKALFFSFAVFLNKDTWSFTPYTLILSNPLCVYYESVVFELYVEMLIININQT
jgi:hypothetical protein